jgi:hypothetical protein
MLSSFFFLGGESICSGTALDYVPGEWIGESHMVCDAYLFVLQIHACNVGVCWQGEM